MMFRWFKKKSVGGCVMLTQLTRGKLQFMDAPEQSLLPAMRAKIQTEAFTDA